jgi:hypothetical protein
METWSRNKCFRLSSIPSKWLSSPRLEWGGGSQNREAMPIGKDTRARTFHLFLHHPTKLAINIPLFTTVYKATTDGRATRYGLDGPGIESR